MVDGVSEGAETERWVGERKWMSVVQLRVSRVEKLVDEPQLMLKRSLGLKIWSAMERKERHHNRRKRRRMVPEAARVQVVSINIM